MFILRINTLTTPVVLPLIPTIHSTYYNQLKEIFNQQLQKGVSI